MKRSILMVAVWMCVSLTALAGDQPITIVDAPWPPYTLGKAGEAPTGGYAVEFTKAIFGRLGKEIEMRLLPWKRCIAMVKEGQNDVLMLLSYKKDREAWMTFSDPIMVSRDMVWYRSDRTPPLEWETFADLKKYRIGRTAGFNYGDAFNAAEKTLGLRVDDAKSDLHNFKKLLAGRIDMFICNEIAALYLFGAHTEFKGAFKASTKPIKAVALYMGFSKASGADKLVPEVNSAIAELKAEGKIDKILGR